MPSLQVVPVDGVEQGTSHFPGVKGFAGGLCQLIFRDEKKPAHAALDAVLFESLDIASTHVLDAGVHELGARPGCHL